MTKKNAFALLRKHMETLFLLGESSYFLDEQNFVCLNNENKDRVVLKDKTITAPLVLLSEHLPKTAPCFILNPTTTSGTKKQWPIGTRFYYKVLHVISTTMMISALKHSVIVGIMLNAMKEGEEGRIGDLSSFLDMMSEVKIPKKTFMDWCNDTLLNEIESLFVSGDHVQALMADPDFFGIIMDRKTFTASVVSKINDPDALAEMIHKHCPDLKIRKTSIQLIAAFFNRLFQNFKMSPNPLGIYLSVEAITDCHPRFYSTAGVFRKLAMNVSDLLNAILAVFTEGSSFADSELAETIDIPLLTADSFLTMDEIKKVGQSCAPFVTGVVKSLAPETPATASVTASNLQVHTQPQAQPPAPQVPAPPTYQQQAYHAAQQPQPAPKSAEVSTAPKNPFDNDLDGNDKPVGTVPTLNFTGGGSNWLEQQRQQNTVPFYMRNAQGYMVPVQGAPGIIQPVQPMVPQGYQPPMQYQNVQQQQAALYQQQQQQQMMLQQQQQNQNVPLWARQQPQGTVGYMGAPMGNPMGYGMMQPQQPAVPSWSTGVAPMATAPQNRVY